MPTSGCIKILLRGLPVRCIPLPEGDVTDGAPASLEASHADRQESGASQVRFIVEFSRRLSQLGCRTEASTELLALPL